MAEARALERVDSKREMMKVIKFIALSIPHASFTGTFNHASEALKPSASDPDISSLHRERDFFTQAV